MTHTSSGARARVRLPVAPWQSGRILARHLKRVRQGHAHRRVIALEITPTHGGRIIVDLSPTAAVALIDEIADLLESAPTDTIRREESRRDPH